MARACQGLPALTGKVLMFECFKKIERLIAYSPVQARARPVICSQRWYFVVLSQGWCLQHVSQRLSQHFLASSSFMGGTLQIHGSIRIRPCLVQLGVSEARCHTMRLMRGSLLSATDPCKLTEYACTTCFVFCWGPAPEPGLSSADVTSSPALVASETAALAAQQSCCQASQAVPVKFTRSVLIGRPLCVTCGSSWRF